MRPKILGYQMHEFRNKNRHLFPFRLSDATLYIQLGFNRQTAASLHIKNFFDKHFDILASKGRNSKNIQTKIMVLAICIFSVAALYCIQVHENFLMVFNLKKANA